MNIFEVKRYLGPKPAQLCYGYVYDYIDDGRFKSMSAIKDFLRRVIKNDTDLKAKMAMQGYSSYFNYNKDWVEQAKEIFLFIDAKEEDEKIMRR